MEEERFWKSFIHFRTNLLLILNKKKKKFHFPTQKKKTNTKIQYTTLTAANHLSIASKISNHDFIYLIKKGCNKSNIWLSYKEGIRIDNFDKADLICQDYARLLPRWVWAMATRHVFCELNKLCPSDCITACQAFGYCRVFCDCLSSPSLNGQRWNRGSKGGAVESLPNTRVCMYV